MLQELDLYAHVNVFTLLCITNRLRWTVEGSLLFSNFNAYIYTG